MLIANLRKLQALGMLISEATIRRESAGQRTQLLRAVVANVCLVAGTAGMILSVLLLSSALLPPLGVMLALAVVLAGVAWLQWRFLVRVYARAQIALKVTFEANELGQAEIESTDLGQVEQMLVGDPAITHVAMVHCETTTGMLNPVEAVGEIVHRHGREFILDAMSSFGGIPMSMESTGAQYLISSANKCVQGVPGFGFVVADRATLEATKGRARSHSLDLFDQWREMETKGGKWRFTSPTHVVSAFAQALDELEAEGGVEARHTRYVANQRTMVEGMREIGFRTLIGDEVQSPIITSFYYPNAAEFDFQKLYDALKSRGFVIYPGKVSHAQCFRIGSIGDVHPSDMTQLIGQISEVLEAMGVCLTVAS